MGKQGGFAPEELLVSPPIMSPPIPHLTMPAAPSSDRATQKSREIK